MDLVTRVHPEVMITVPRRRAMNKCNLFENNQALLASPYRVKSPVTLTIFREFVAELERNAVAITNTNFRRLQQLPKGFGFDDLTVKLLEVQPSICFKESEDTKARRRTAALEEKVEQHTRMIAVLQSEFRQLSTNFERLEQNIATLRFTSAGIPALFGADSALKTRITKEIPTEVSDFGSMKTQIAGLTSPPPTRSTPLHPSRIGRLPLRRRSRPPNPLRCSIRGSFRTFRRSSRCSEESNSTFCGGEIATVSLRKNFTADVTVTQTL
jgi:hypothetical protein